MNNIVTDTGGRYVLTQGTVPVEGVQHPGAILGIQSLSYQDAGMYTCETRETNSTDPNDWISANVDLQLNSKLLVQDIKHKTTHKQCMIPSLILTYLFHSFSQWS